MFKPLIAVIGFLSLGSLSQVGHTKPLTQQQQLMMYRSCRATHSDKDLYFAKKFCGCSVQAFLNDIPVERAAKDCVAYARTNG